MADYVSRLTSQQIESVLTGVNGVNGVVARYGQNSYRAAVPRDIGAVSYSVQELSAAEKAQARANIGAGVYNKPTDGIPASDLTQSAQASLGKADSAVQDVTINGASIVEQQIAKIVYETGLGADSGNAATVTAIRAFVNSSINSVAAYYITADANRNAFATKSALDAGPWYYAGQLRTPTKNDYAIVIADETHGGNTARYTYTEGGWDFQYPFNMQFTQAQIDAINSGITAAKVALYDAHITSTANPHNVTKSQVGLGDVDNTSDAAKKTLFTGTIATENTGFVTGDSMYTALADKANASALELTNKLLTLLAKLTKGQAWDTEAGATPAYEQTAPAGAKAVAVKSIGGRTLVFNQVLGLNIGMDFTAHNIRISYDNEKGLYKVEVNETPATDKNDWAIKSVSTGWYSFIEGHKYLYYTITTNEHIGTTLGNSSIIKQNRIETGLNGIYTYRAIVTAGCPVGTYYFKTQIIDLTQMFGAGNEPATVEEFKAMCPLDYYEYNEGELVSANVVSVDSTGSDDTPLGTIAIPAEVRALEGYGQSHGSEYNYLDLEHKKFVEVGHYVNGVWTAHAQEIDVSAYIGDDNLLTVEGGGKLTFTQSNLTFNIPVPNDTEYAINLSEATA